MATQMENLQEEIADLKVRLGPDALIVRALQQQLDGYKSMEVNREQNFRVGTIPKSSATSLSDEEHQLKMMGRVDAALERLRSASPEPTSANKPEPT